MITLLGIFSFILGTIVGSFLNVVVLRYGTGMGLGGRSRCMSSGQVLAWYELVPVLSFLVQKGRSRRTGAKLSRQYIIVELLTGLLFCIAFSASLPFFFFGGILPAVVSFIFLSLCASFVILASVYDVKHMIIPNEFSYPLIILAFVSLFVSLEPIGFLLPSLASLVAGPLVALPFALLWFVSGGKWMGFADAKIALAIGWFVGISSGFASLLIGVCLGALLGIVLIFVRGRTRARGMMIPFGPFILTGLIVSFLYTIDMNSFISFVAHAFFL